MGIRDSISNMFLGREKTRLKETADLLYKAYLEGPYLMSPQDLQRQLKEVDSSILVDMVNQMGYDSLGTLWGGYSEPTEAERLRAIDESRRLYRYDVITQWVVWLWTNFGFGENIEITPSDEAGLDAWHEFWAADRNQSLFSEDNLHALSEDLLVDGEKYLAFFISKLDGKSTVRDVDTKEVSEIITHPDDDKMPLYYKRSWNVSNGQHYDAYYPDWLAKLSGVLDEEYEDPRTGEKKPLKEVVLPPGVVTADEQKEQTDVCLLHIAHNRKGGMRGWPLMSAAAPWSRAHKKFREDRSAVASTVAMFVNKVKVAGGSRAVDAIKAKLGSSIDPSTYRDNNPQAIAGSTFIENPAASLERMPLGTSAGDAKTDGEALLLMAGLGGGVYPHWMGAGDSYRLATASSMESPMYREFSRYQKFWGAQFRKMVRIVFWGLSEYGGESLEDVTVEVSTDKLLQTDLTALSSGLSSIFGTLFGPYINSGVIPIDTGKKLLAQAWSLGLQTLGIVDPSELTSDKAFGVGKKPEPIAPAQFMPQNPAVATQPGAKGEQIKGGVASPTGGTPAATKRRTQESALSNLELLRDSIRRLRQDAEVESDES